MLFPEVATQIVKLGGWILGGISALAISTLVSWGLTEWWPWALCYVEVLGLDLMVYVSDKLVGLFPAPMGSADIQYWSDVYVLADQWFPVTDFASAVTFYFSFLVAFTVVKIGWRATPFG